MKKEMEKRAFKKALFFVVAFMLAACSRDNSSLKITGSDTVLPLTQKEVEVYMRRSPESKISVTGGGSGVGIAALAEGIVDIAQASRKMKFEEILKIGSKGKAVEEIVIAYDALAVVVNNDNVISNLTREQLEDIFTGKIQNWKEVGGDDIKIIPYSRETSSGTYEFFKEHVLENKNYKNGILSMPATGAMIQSVSQTRGAIGYVGLAYLDKAVKAVHISYDSGRSFVEPSFENAGNRSYPIVRPLYYYYLTASESKVDSFIRFVRSDEGQQAVKQLGYIPFTQPAPNNDEKKGKI